MGAGEENMVEITKYTTYVHGQWSRKPLFVPPIHANTLFWKQKERKNCSNCKETHSMDRHTYVLTCTHILTCTHTLLRGSPTISVHGKLLLRFMREESPNMRDSYNLIK